MENLGFLQPNRNRNFTQNEKNVLSALVHHKYRHIVEIRSTTTLIINQKSVAWCKITEEFNKFFCNFKPRSTSSLRKCYQNMKYKQKKISSSDPVLENNSESDMSESLQAKPSSQTQPVKISNAEVVESVFASYGFSVPQPTATSRTVPALSVKNFASEVVNPVSPKGIEIYEPDNVEPSEIPDNIGLNEPKDTQDPCEGLNIQLIKEKINVIQTYNENAKEESRRKCRILDEQLTQERIKTKMLLSKKNT